MKRTVRHLTLLIAATALVGVAPLAAPMTLAQSQPASARVDATHEGWIDTGLDLPPGGRVTLTASGRGGWEPGIEVGPEGAGATPCTLIAPEAPVGAVLARVGAGAPVIVGSGVTLAGPGRLSLLYNDCPGQYFDNAGAFDVQLAVTLPPPPATPAPLPTTAPVPEPGPVAAEPAAPSKDGGLPLLPVALLALLAGGGAAVYFARGYGSRGATPEFSPTARLESSAWLAPVRLRALQGERRLRRSLSIGGPDADIDFGLPGIWARLYPTADGGARLETLPGAGRIMVDGGPVVIGQRLSNGARIFMGTREFVYRLDAEGADNTGGLARYRQKDPLAKPDPRVA